MRPWMSTSLALIVTGAVVTAPAASRACGFRISDEYRKKVAQRADEGWDVPPLTCPQGTRLRVIEHKDALTQRCETPNGQTEGPVRAFRIKFDGVETVQEGEYREGVRHGTWKDQRRSDGVTLSESRYKNGLLDGWSRYYDGDGNLLTEAWYSRGKLDGPYRRYQAEEQLIAEYWYSDGKPDGNWRSWHPNGDLAALMHYDNGVQTGEFRTWHPNGQLREVGYYQNGQLDGLYSEWDEDGRRRSEGTYTRGTKSGTWTVWDGAGEWHYEDHDDREPADGIPGELRKAAVSASRSF